MLDKQIQLGQSLSSPHTIILTFPRPEITMIALPVTEPFQNFSPAIWRVFHLLKKSQDLKHIICQR